MKHPEIDDAQVVALYTVGHLTVRQIGARLGMSHAAIAKRLKRRGVPARLGEHIQTECAQCHKLIDRVRCRARKTRRAFCSNACYFAARHNPNFVISRSGAMRARVIVSAYFDLLPAHVVHHEDSNQRNNDLANLRVFASQSDHLRFHHGADVRPIWDGRAPWL